MTTKTAVKTEWNYGCVQLDVDRFSEDYEFLTTTYDDGTVEVTYKGDIVDHGTTEDTFLYGDLAAKIRDSEDFAYDYEWREDR